MGLFWESYPKAALIDMDLKKSELRDANMKFKRIALLYNKVNNPETYLTLHSFRSVARIWSKTF